MVKTRETWVWEEEIDATTGTRKLEAQNIDAVTRGQLVHSSCDVVCGSLLATPGILSPNYIISLFSYPYNGDKQVYDLLTIVGAWQIAWQAPNVGPAHELQYSLDDCVTWSPATFIKPPTSGAVWPCAAMNASYPYVTALANIVADWGSHTVDLSSVTGYVDLAVRFGPPGGSIPPAPTTDAVGWWLTAFLHNSTDTPF